MIPAHRVPRHLRADVQACLDDFVEFCACLFWITDKGGKRIPFVLNPAQILVAEALILYSRIAIPKARQLGVSFVVRAWHAYLALTSKEPRVYATLAHHHRAASNLHSVGRSLLRSLPSILQPEYERETQTEIVLSPEWGGCTLACYSAASSTGTRSWALAGAHLSEYDYCPDPVGLLAAVEASVGRGQLIIESTATGPGTAFHKLCTSTPGWHVLFLPWTLDPSYALPLEPGESPPPVDGLTPEQAKWWLWQCSQPGGEDRARLEYPLTLEDCFRPGSGAWLTIPSTVVRDATFPQEPPQPNEAYAMGVDPSGGTGGDYAAVVVTAKSTGQVVYVWRSNSTTPVQLAHHVLDVATRYKAKVLCESNNHGHSVLSTLRQLGFFDLWVDPKQKAWVTTHQSKLRAFEALRTWVTSECASLPMALAMEVSSLRLTDAGTPSAPDGMHDDLAVALALSLICLQGIVQAPVLSPARSAMVQHLRDQRRTRGI